MALLSVRFSKVLKVGSHLLYGGYLKMALGEAELLLLLSSAKLQGSDAKQSACAHGGWLFAR